MRDVDLIAYVYPCEDGEDIASAAIRSSTLYVPGTTPPRLELRFSNFPSNAHGFVFGSGKDCAMIIPDNYASSLHFAVSFDKERRLVIKDLGSLRGTQVTYDGQGSGVRRNFTWIIGGNKMARKNRPIVIELSDNLSFEIKAAHYDVESQAYLGMVDRLCRDSRPALLNSQQCSGADEHNTESIYLALKLREGGFGVVTLRCNVSNGSKVAVKSPVEGKYNRAAWMKEGKIMSKLHHVPPYRETHQVGFHESARTVARRHATRVVGRTLQLQHNDTQEDSFSLTPVFGGTDVPSYLRNPDVHRDIKPGNILIRHHDHDSIYVKLADFGLSREAFKMESDCGTSRYKAPEIGRTSYTKAVDIWSLGVVGYELMRDLGHSRKHGRGGWGWCEEITNKLKNDKEKWPCSPMLRALDKMLVMSPKSRSSSEDCLEFVSGLLKTEVSDHLTPTQTDGENQATTQVSSGNEAAGGPVIVIEKTATGLKPRKHSPEYHGTVIQETTFGPNSGNPDPEDHGAMIEEPNTNRGNVLGKRVLWSRSSGMDEAAAASNPRKRIRLREATARQDSEHRIAEAQRADVPSAGRDSEDSLDLSTLLGSLPSQDGNNEEHHGASSAVAENSTQGSVGDNPTRASNAQQDTTMPLEDVDPNMAGGYLRGSLDLLDDDSI
ncbi:hypothetical protein QQZ08_003768 [Neonectria magnoliae]|uniref:Protein kinase domain-containing protein n=1 Tax=Neonectria magnoliae TaxID=2732573 RepID=A0ABR1IA07_9HYPO